MNNYTIDGWRSEPKRSAAVQDLALFSHRFFSEVTEEGQLVAFTVRDFDEHPDPGTQEDGFQQAAKAVVRSAMTRDRTNDPVHHQPGDEQVQSLKGMEAGVVIVAKTVGGEHDETRNPA